MCRLRNIALESVTEKCDRRTTDKVIPMCRYASQATQKVQIKAYRPTLFIMPPGMKGPPRGNIVIGSSVCPWRPSVCPSVIPPRLQTKCNI